MYKILIVDDDPDMVEAVRIVLEREGHQVESAPNATDGLVKLEVTQPDLVILDVMMEEPDDGLQFARRVRKDGKAVPILMLTSVNRALGLQIGKDEEIVPVDEFMEKPLDPATLVDKVKRLLEEPGEE
ncbi:MAG: response regulator transcription factor [Actinobacteria bacterium]|nr:response regulator transcription factor [Actinomycetota bacterium]